MADLVSMGNIKTSPEIRRRVRIHVASIGRKMGEWLEEAMIAALENETMSAQNGKGERNEKQKDEHETHHV